MTLPEQSGDYFADVSANYTPPADPVETVEEKPPVIEPETQAPPEGEAEKPKPEDDGSDKEKRPGRRERQIERERQENQRLRAELDALRSQAPPSLDKSNTDTGPKIEDFADALEYAEARAEWKMEQKLKARDEAQVQAIQQAKLQELVADHEDREIEYAETVPDYEEKVTSLLRTGHVTPEIQVAVLHSEMSPQIAYHLANNYQKAVELGVVGQSDLAQLQALQSNPPAFKMAIKQIEAFIKSNPIDTAVKTTKAAPPINPVKSTSGGSTKDLSTMSLRELDKVWKPL